MSDADSEQVDLAKAIAYLAHRGQTDKAGRPYIEHPAAVAHAVAGEGWVIVASAWLHDVMEDTDITADDLRACGILEPVIRTVDYLTRWPNQSPEDYYERMRESAAAMTVKTADIAHNSDLTRLALLDDETVVRLTRKYAKARMLLAAAWEEPL